MRKALTYSLTLFLCLLCPWPAFATQTHGGLEGLYSHLIAHVIFLGSMIYLCVRLIRSGESRRPGWGHIFISAVLFSLWNIETLYVHSYSEFIDPAAFSGDFFGLKLTFHAESIGDLLYYLGRFDHALAFPALLFLFLGIRSLLERTQERI